MLRSCPLSPCPPPVAAILWAKARAPLDYRLHGACPSFASRPAVPRAHFPPSKPVAMTAPWFRLTRGTGAPCADATRRQSRPVFAGTHGTKERIGTAGGGSRGDAASERATARVRSVALQRRRL